MPSVVALFIYPIKACGAIALTQAEVTPRGLMSGVIGDRRWMLCDSTGAFLTQRDLPELARVKLALIDQARGIRASVAGQAPLDLRPDDVTGETVASAVHGNPVTGHRVGAPADRWFSAFLRKDVRLLFQTESDLRFSSLHFSPRPGVDMVSFADGYQILLTNHATLDRVNARLAVPVPMSRFRPNLTVKDAVADAEYGWQDIAIGQTGLALVKPCTRCVVTTIDQATGERTGQEPLAVLAKDYFLNEDFNGKRVQGAIFGENAVPIRCGPISAGMDITVRRTKPVHAFRRPTP